MNGDPALEAGAGADAQSAPDAGHTVIPRDGSTAIDGATTIDGSTAADTSTPVDSSTPPDAGIPDAQLLDADHGGPSTTYPAFPPDQPQLVQNGGPTLTNPTIVTITWDADPDRAKYEGFGDGLGASDYWRAAVGEWGITGATSGAVNHVHIATAPPATLTDTQLQTMIKTNAGQNGWPAVQDQIIYSFYIPAATKFKFGTSDACAEASGYHDNLPQKISNKWVSYAVMLHCPGATADDSTVTAAHEFGEASTDPYPSTQAPGLSLAGFDADHLNWEFFWGFADENGDVCNYGASVETEPAPFNYAVQRLWSNVSAHAGHNPCLPLASEPYYGVTEFKADQDTISVDLSSIGGTITPSKGFKIPLNTSRTFAVGFYSDAATTGPWNLTAVFDAQSVLTDAQGNPLSNGALTISVDKASGINGEKAYITVTPTAVGAGGVEFFYLKSALPGAKGNHYLPILITN